MDDIFNQNIGFSFSYLLSGQIFFSLYSKKLLSLRERERERERDNEAYHMFHNFPFPIEMSPSVLSFGLFVWIKSHLDSIL